MKTLFQFMFLFFSGVVYAQGGLIIGENSQLVIKGELGIVVKDGKFQNDGEFSAGNGSLIMYGTAPTEGSTIGGSSITNFYDLIIAKSSHDVRLDYDIVVDRDLEVQDGMFILNYSDVHLGGSIIGETEQSRITGTEGGAIIKVVDLDAPLAVNPGNMGLEITTAENLGLTTIRRSHVARENNGNFSIDRYFSLDPQNNSNLDATLRMHYFDGELSGATESELELWRFDETEWLSFEPAQSNTSENWIESSGVDFLYDFTLAENLEGSLPIELL
jgi:hypothetical protein